MSFPARSQISVRVTPGRAAQDRLDPDAGVLEPAREAQGQIQHERLAL